MFYNAVVEMAQSASLRNRVAACAAAEGVTNPEQWAASKMWALASSPGWAEDWAYAQDTYTVNQNPDTGARTDVIGDAQILAAVQALSADPEA